MAVIGNSSTQQAFTPAIDYFSGNGSTTAFTLSRPVASVAQVQVTIDNVAQNPSSAYTISGSTITFTSAPLSGTNNIYVYYTSPITQVIAPGQGTVNTTALGNITNIASGNSSLTLQTGSGNTTAVTVDTSQNVGVGVTPSTWSTGKVVEVSNVGSAIWGGSSLTAITAGYYYNSGDKYAITGNYALQFQMNYSTGAYIWYGTNSTGTAGNAATVVERMRINSSGYVGIGTTSPETKVQIEGTADTVGATLRITSTGVCSAGMAVNATGLFFAADTGGFVWKTGAQNLPTTSGTERMRIGSNGQIYMATSSAVAPGGPSGQVNILNPNNDGNWALALQNNATTTSNARGLGIKFNVDFNNNSNEFIYCTGGSNGRFYVNANGGVYNYSANNVNLSDRREKKKIEPAPSYLDKICQIPVKTFLFNDQTDTDLNLGVIAQDVQAVCPELITESNWGTKEEPRMRLSIYEADLKYALMKSIQELKAINDTQAETINALTARIEALENR